MLKIKNKFIIFIILLLVLIISFWIFKAYIENNNKNSFIVLVDWKAMLNKTILKVDNRIKLSIWDTVRTIWENALAVLEWWDGSVTRIWWNSSLKIEELHVSDDVWTINIGFRLLSGKSWSNVVSFLWEDSYFKEYFRDSEAAARWTVFSLDLNNDYIQVIDHKITINTQEKSFTIDENKPFNIKTFSFISLEKFIKSIKDKAWQNMNSKIDKELFLELKTKLNTNIENFKKFKDINIEKVLNNVEEKEKLYKELLSDYQKLNFIKSEDKELFKTKLELKNTLIKLADTNNKKILVENTLYDFKDSILKKEYENIESITSILSENKDLLWDIDFKIYFPINVIPEELKEIFKNDFNKLKNIFWETFSKRVDFNSLKEKGDSIIKGVLNDWKERIDNLFNN